MITGTRRVVVLVWKKPVQQSRDRAENPERDLSWKAGFEMNQIAMDEFVL
jgi:hypothetical protein